MKNHCGGLVGFSFRTACCCHSDFVNVKFLRLMSCCHTTFLLISLSCIMILLAFLSCFLVFFFLREGPNSFFSIKGNYSVFELQCVPCVYLFDRVIATKFELQPV